MQKITKEIIKFIISLGLVVGIVGILKEPLEVKASITLKAGVSFESVSGNYDEVGTPSGYDTYYSHQRPYFILTGGSDVYIKNVTLHIYNSKGQQVYGKFETGTPYFHYINILPDQLSAGEYTYEWEYYVTTGSADNDYFTSSSGKISFTVTDLTLDVTFNANWGYCSTSSKNVTYGDRYGALPSPTRTGYTFAGWYTERNGGSQVTSSTTVSVTSNQTLYAHWTANAYTVSFNPNGGHCNTTSKSVTYESSYGVLPTPAQTGYIFSGWYTSASGGSQVTSSMTVSRSSNHTLYAHWTADTYTATFNANGGSCSTSSKSVTYGSSYGTLPTPIRTGYRFSGWYTSASGGSQVTSNTIVSRSSNHTLYAHWTANTYTVTFNANGGSSTSSKSVAYGNTYGTLPTPTWTGYSFSGWYTSLSGGSQVTYSTTVNVARNHTLYAHWTKNPEPTPVVPVTPSTEPQKPSGGTQQPQTEKNGGNNRNPEPPAGNKEPTEAELNVIAKENNQKTVTSSNISLKSATGVCEADRYIALGKIKVGKKKFTLRLNTNGVKNIAYKSSKKKVATVTPKGVVKLRGIGKTTITVTATVSSTGKKVTKKYQLTINPGKITLKSVKSSAAGQMKISWKKDSRSQGYQFTYSTSRNFKKGTKSFNVSKNSITKVTVTNLMRGIKYYVRVRSYKAVSGKPYYGAWSRVKTVKIK